MKYWFWQYLYSMNSDGTLIIGSYKDKVKEEKV